MARTWRKGTSGTWCTPGGRGAEQGTGTLAGERPGGRDPVSPTRAPCLSDAGSLPAGLSAPGPGLLVAKPRARAPPPRWAGPAAPARPSCSRPMELSAPRPPRLQRHRPPRPAGIPTALCPLPADSLLLPAFGTGDRGLPGTQDWKGPGCWLSPKSRAVEPCAWGSLDGRALAGEMNCSSAWHPAWALLCSDSRLPASRRLVGVLAGP